MDVQGDQHVALDVTGTTSASVADDTHMNDTYDASMEAYVMPTLFGLIFVTGLAGNGSVLFILMRNRTMQSVPHAYLGGLAAADLLLLVVSVPFTSVIFTLPQWPFGLAVCKLNEFAQTMSAAVSVSTLTVLSVERYRAITNTPNHNPRQNRHQVAIISVAVWSVSVILATPDAIASNLKKVSNNSQNYVCTPFPQNWGPWYPQFHTIARFVLLFAAPLAVTFTCYSLLARHLLLSPDYCTLDKTLDKDGILVQQDKPSSLGTILARRRALAKVVLCLVGLFVVCWLPRHIFLFWFHFDPGSYNLFWHCFKMASFCLVFLHSALQPFMLFLVDCHFRSHFCDLLCRCLTSRKSIRNDIMLQNLEDTQPDSIVTSSSPQIV